MSKSSSSQTLPAKKSLSKWYLLLLPVWVVVAFYAAQLVIGLLQLLLLKSGVPLEAIRPALYSTVLSLVIYALALFIVMYVPYKFWRRRTTYDELGIGRLPRLSDVGWSIPATFFYFVCSAVLLYTLMAVVPDGVINWRKEQSLPFSANMLGSSFEYVLAFMTLAILVPIAEEVLFRGYLFGKLRKISRLWVSVLITSVTFGSLHLGFGAFSDLQWNVTIDTFVFSVVMCLMREMTGSIWVGVLMHMFKNGLAFYFLFVNPQLIPAMGAWLL